MIMAMLIFLLADGIKILTKGTTMNAIKHKNRTELIGEVTRDAVLAYTPSGVAVLKFSIETRRDYEGKTYRTFHNIVAWAKTAEENAIIRKGDIVMIDGETTNRSYEDKKTGEKKYITEVNAQSIIILQSRTNAEPTSGTEETQPQKQTDDLPF